MKKFSRVLIGGALVVCGCGFFLYPNFREWNTQREVNQIIESFDKKYSESINANDSSDTVVETSDKNDYKESKNQHAATLTATPAEAQKSTGESVQPERQNGDNNKSSTKNKPYQELYNKMQEYNQDLLNNGQNISDAWDYEQQPFDLNGLGIDSDNPAIGYIEIPDMKIRLPLMLGASMENLEKGAAVLSGTSMPIGGDSTNCVIAAHRGWNGSAYFQYIENMKVGSRVYVTNPWETLIYECTNIQIINPDDTNTIMIQKNKDMITLLTCHPYVLGGGPYRYLVYCERVDAQTRKESNGAINPKSKSPASTDTSVNEESQKEDTSTTLDDSTIHSATSSDITVDIQNKNGVDLLALEQTLRYILPIFAILVSALIISLRVQTTKKNKKLKKKKKNHNKKKPKIGNKRRK